MSINEEGFLSHEIEQWIKKYREENHKLFILSIELNRFAQSILLKLEINNGDIQKIISSALFARLISQYQSIIILIERGLVNEAKIILRVMLDNLFILVAITKDKKYTKFYINDDIEKRIHFLNRFSKNIGNHYDDILEKLDKEKIARELKELIEKKETLESDELKLKGMITTKKWAEFSEMESLYYRLYAQFNDAVHTLSRELEQYVSVNSNGEISKINWGPDVDGVDIVLTTSADFLCRALSSINGFFGFDNLKVEEYWKKIDKVEIRSQKMEIKSFK